MNSAPVMLQGAIDLLDVDNDKKTDAIVDYKYTSNINCIRDRYFLQLRSYKLAVEEAFEGYEVKSYIYAIKQSKLVEIC